MIVAGVHVGPIILIAIFIMNVVGFIVLSRRIRVLERSLRRAIGVIIKNGWPIDDNQESPETNTT